MTEQEQRKSPAPIIDEEMAASYKQAIERAISHLPVKNGVVNIDSIWIETSIPYVILDELLRRDDLELPDNVDRINLKSNVRAKEQIRKSRHRRKRKPRAKG
ncbi:hypothetical protein KAJ02_05160 [Candidatus Bipolaricaulota bacterium]|nr:hypothetical protein [Candidatus Bipolaricaulota bacterium]